MLGGGGYREDHPMTTPFDLLIKNGTVVNQDGTGKADIGILGGKIAEIGDLTTRDAGDVIDATGLHILPGVIDSQVHFREPGMEHKEDLALPQSSRCRILSR